MRAKILMAVIVVVAVIGIGVGVGLLAARPGKAPPLVATQDSTPHNTPAPMPPANPAPIVIQHPQVTPQPAPIQPVPVVQSNAVAQPATNTDTEAEWEDKIDNIIGSDNSDSNKVNQLFALFPTLPPDGQEEVVQHLSNLVDDENYAQLGELLKNDKLPEGVLDELLADALNRPNNLKLPLLLDVASDPNNAKSSEAKDLLELYLGEDYGNDWNTWGTQMTNWLQKNPD